MTGSLAGSHYKAFVPKPLPPKALRAFCRAMVAPLERANPGLGRLDGTTLMLPDPAVFLYQYVRKGASPSAQMEGTQASLSDRSTPTIHKALSAGRHEKQTLPKLVCENFHQACNLNAAYHLGEVSTPNEIARVMVETQAIVAAMREATR